MKHYILHFVLAGFLALMSIQCSSVPITGRSQLNLVSSSEMQAMSYQQYSEFLKTSKISNDQTGTQLVKRVGGKIQKAVEEYFALNNLQSELSGYKWEFNLIEDKQVNAFCMPGGKVVVYSGILPVTKDETSLGVVLGHEIAHAVAKHGDERMSQEMLTQMGGLALQKAIETKPEETKSLWMSAFGLGTQLGVLLPYSRLHESEADRLGLVFMAMAGYNPNEAIAFWKRMSDLNQQKPLEFLSTHPSDETRIADIKKEIPEAMKYYKKK